jgi:Flp pilus assembly pilin Flp
MMAAAKRLWDDTSGQGLAEYALLLGMVIIGVIVLLQGIGLSVQKIFTATNSDLETAAAAAS